jgi:hypothetical protein
MSNAANTFGTIIQGAVANVGEMEERVGSLESSLRTAAERFAAMTPAGVQRALDRKVEIAAEEKAKAYMCFGMQ